MVIYSDFTTFFTLTYLKQLCFQVTCQLHQHCQLHQQAAHYPWITLPYILPLLLCSFSLCPLKAAQRLLELPLQCVPLQPPPPAVPSLILEKAAELVQLLPAVPGQLPGQLVQLVQLLLQLGTVMPDTTPDLTCEPLQVYFAFNLNSCWHLVSHDLDSCGILLYSLNVASNILDKILKLCIPGAGGVLIGHYCRLYRVF